MDAYTGFASVYEEFMDNVPYEEWCDYVCEILKKYGIRDGLVLDLGCGTGSMTRLLRAQGYDMIGVDLSGEMLEVAREHEMDDLSGENSTWEPDKKDSTAPILYLQQDMREFELYGTVRAVICLCDSMNYLLEEEDLEQVFRLVNNYLDPGGIFIFDMNTRYKYRDVIGDTTICENREHECFTWENYFDEDSDINEYALNIFTEQENGLYERCEEFHYQRAYDMEKVADLVNKSGLKLLSVYGEGTYEFPAADAERIYFVAQEQGKTAGRPE